MERKAFGIDLGTTNSAIALYQNNEVTILKNMEGFDITPSVIFFTGVTPSGDDDMLVGEYAKNAAATNPDNVVQFIKRRMGQSGPQFNHIGPSGKEYTPEMLSAFILRKIAKDAEQFVGDGEVKDVVITVPAYFDDARRTATKQAGAIAGLNVLAVINEPTAAAIAFGLDKGANSRVLVYDLGGGTFDVTVMDIQGNHFDTIATGGDHALGGYNFDGKMSELIQRKLSEQGIELDDEDDALFAEIREKAEKAKLQLSSVQSTRPVFTINGKTCRIEITRDEFEAATADLMQRTRILLEEVMADKHISWSEIDELLVVGGSTRMPMVKKMLEEISGKTVTYKIDPDTAVAQGAAIFAGTFDLNAAEGAPKKDARAADSEADRFTSKITISDVTSQSLGVITLDYDTRQERNTIVIPHNSKIPTTRSVEVYTVDDNQTRLRVRVTEGDEENVEFVKVIGSSTLSIPPYPKGSPVEIVYAYDPDQMVFIEVIDKVTNRSLGTFQIDRASNLTADQVTKATGIVGRANVE